MIRYVLGLALIVSATLQPSDAFVTASARGTAVGHPSARFQQTQELPEPRGPFAPETQPQIANLRENDLFHAHPDTWDVYWIPERMRLAGRALEAGLQADYASHAAPSLALPFVPRPFEASRTTPLTFATGMFEAHQFAIAGMVDDTVRAYDELLKGAAQYGPTSGVVLRATQAYASDAVLLDQYPRSAKLFTTALSGWCWLLFDVASYATSSHDRSRGDIDSARAARLLALLHSVEPSLRKTPVANERQALDQIAGVRFMGIDAPSRSVQDPVAAVLDDGVFAIVDDLHNLGALALVRGDRAEAERLWRLDAEWELFSGRPRFTRYVTALLERDGHHDEADRIWERVLALPDPHSLRESRLFFDAGSFYYRRGDAKKSIVYFERYGTSLRAAGDFLLPADASVRLAVMYARSGRAADAARLADIAVRQLTETVHYDLPLGSLADKQGYDDKLRDTLDTFIALVDPHQHPPACPACSWHVVGAVTLLKGSLVEQYLQTIASGGEKGFSSMSGDSRTYLRLRAALDDALFSAAPAEAAPSPAASLPPHVYRVDNSAPMQPQLDAINKAERERTDRITLQRLLPNLESQLRLDPNAGPVNSSVVRALRPHETAIEYVYYHAQDRAGATSAQTRLAAVVVSADGAPEWKDLGPADEVDDLVDDLTLLLQDESRAGATNVQQSTDDARKLYDKLLLPFEGRLRGSTLVTIAPDGELNFLSFAVLRDAQGKAAIERFALRYLSSLREFSEQRDGGTGSGKVVVFAAPDLAGEHVNVDELPGADVEGRAIVEALPGTTLVEGQGASKAALFAVADPLVLHFSTHGHYKLPNGSRSGGETPTGFEDIGLYAPTAPDEHALDPMSRAYIRLALGGPANDPLNNGRLTPVEAAVLNLHRTELVTLSSCDSGLGYTRRIDGVYGLRLGFKEAGSRSQLVSPWRVSDAASSKLMPIFYRLLAGGTDRVEALRQAQLQMLASPGTSAPLYWGGFMMYGATGAIQGLPRSAK